MNSFFKWLIGECSSCSRYKTATLEAELRGDKMELALGLIKERTNFYDKLTKKELKIIIEDVRRIIKTSDKENNE